MKYVESMESQSTSLTMDFSFSIALSGVLAANTKHSSGSNSMVGEIRSSLLTTSDLKELPMVIRCITLLRITSKSIRSSIKLWEEKARLKNEA